MLKNFIKIIYILPIILLGMAVSVEAQVAKKDTTKSAATDSSKTVLDEAALEAELAKELGASQGTAAPASAPDKQSKTTVSGTVSRTGTILNPRISVVGTFLGTGTSNDAVNKTYDAGLSEAEISFQAYVDPYTKADFFVAFGHESEDPFAGPDIEAASNGEFTPELEEGYLTTLSLPFSLQIKAGKFRSGFGKINSTHPHALNFVDLPLMYTHYLGGEGLSDRGISVNWLIPNPFDLYEELTVEITSGALEESPSFSSNGKTPLYLAHLKNFIDLNENTTLELGLSGLYGVNDEASHKTKIGAADLTLRWKPLRLNRYRSFEWMSEVLFSRRDMPLGQVNSMAFYTFLRYQIAKRWFLAGRFDYSEFPEDNQQNDKAYSAILSFFTTEFQKFELQYQYGLPAEFDNFHRLLFRAVFVIGAHGAHKY